MADQKNPVQDSDTPGTLKEGSTLSEAKAEAEERREAARRLGQARSERKAAAVRENGKKGGRPPGSRNSAETKARMQQAQLKRRAREQGNNKES
jgi:hypothetical protein